MAAIRTGIADIAQGWVDLDMSPTFATATTFTTPANNLAYLQVGTRVRASDATTLYGTVISASFSTNTGVTVTWDSGSITASLSSIAVSVVRTAPNSNVPTTVGLVAPATISSTAVSVMLTLTNTNTLCGQKFHCSAGEKVVRVNNASNFQVVNSANTVAIMDLTDAGAVTFASNVTAFSDERLKSNWRSLPPNFISQMAAVRVGTFDMEGHDDRMIGVGAQSLQRPMPEAVMRNENGVLSVAYGNAALATCIELCREVVALRNRVDELENKQ